jgi:hypothetical protein
MLSTTTDGTGNYELRITAAVGPLNDTLEAEAVGYDTDSRPVSLNPGDLATENFSLNPTP